MRKKEGSRGGKYPRPRRGGAPDGAETDPAAISDPGPRTTADPGSMRPASSSPQSSSAAPQPPTSAPQEPPPAHPPRGEPPAGVVPPAPPPPRSGINARWGGRRAGVGKSPTEPPRRCQDHSVPGVTAGPGGASSGASCR